MIRLNDTDYTPELIREHRNHIITLRNNALEVNNFEWALLLSITIGLLEALAQKEKQLSI